MLFNALLVVPRSHSGLSSLMSLAHLQTMSLTLKKVMGPHDLSALMPPEPQW